MTEDDDEFLKDYNARRPAAQRLSEDDFEKLMDVFEESAAHQTPFAAVDKTILPYDNMVYGINSLADSAKLLPHAKEMYGHWKSRRLALGNGPLHAALKFETHQDSDDMDPYVCFRRREVRQTRKTRARDVQSADKLKRLRRELEDGRQLVLLSHERELQKRDLLRLDKHIFEKRAQVKEMKVRLGIKGDDADLINQKVSLSPTSWFADTANPLRSLPRRSPQRYQLHRDRLGLEPSGCSSHVPLDQQTWTCSTWNRSLPGRPRNCVMMFW